MRRPPVLAAGPLTLACGNSRGETDADGKFVIENAPAGEFRIVYWHEEVGFKGGKDGRLGEPLVIADSGKGSMALEPVTFNVAK
jgi:hypothetical protein